jgi:excisionase family DNA binding protein
MSARPTDAQVQTIPVALPLDALEPVLARLVSEALEAQFEAEPEPWYDVERAAEYLACKPDRIYDLKAQGRLEWRKDGTRLLFRREWLDAVLTSEELR